MRIRFRIACATACALLAAARDLAGVSPYDVTSDRPYRRALSVEKAIEELVRFKGTQFDDRVVDTVLKLYHAGQFEPINEMVMPVPEPRELVV